MRPDQTTIVVIGDITPEAAKKIVEANFGGWTSEGPRPAIDLPPVPLSKSSDGRVGDASSQQDSVMLAETIGLPISNPDRYSLLLGNTILSSGFSSRLYRDLRLRTGYVYSVSSDFDWSRTRADYSISFGADADNVPKARALALGDLKAMQAEPVSEPELTRAKAELLRQLPMQRASVRAIAGQYLRIAELGLPLDAADRAAKAYAAMTAEKVREAFAHWVRPDDLAVVVKGP
jgi:zinc protease